MTNTSNAFEGRAAADQILDRLSDDAGFESEIVDNPTAALRSAGVRMEDKGDEENDDVEGYRILPMPPGAGDPGGSGGKPSPITTPPDPGPDPSPPGRTPPGSGGQPAGTRAGHAA